MRIECGREGKKPLGLGGEERAGEVRRRRAEARHVGTGSGVHMADPNSPAKDS